MAGLNPMAVAVVLAASLAASPVRAAGRESASAADPACQPASVSGTGPAAEVKTVIARFNAAIECGDVDVAQALVDAGGQVAEVEESAAEDGKPVRSVRAGPWGDQLFLFARPDSSGWPRAVSGPIDVVVDGPLALARQTLWFRSAEGAERNVCLIRHLMLVDLGQGWKIRQLVLHIDSSACATVDRP